MFRLARDVMVNVQRWWRRIRQSGRIERDRELSDAHAWATDAVQALSAEKARVRDEYEELNAAWFSRAIDDPNRAPREVYYHTLAARYCNVAGWCVTALEAVIAGGLSILLLTLVWPLASLLGVTITILLAVGLKGVVAPLVVGRYADRPKAGRDLGLRVLLVAGPVAILLVAVIFIIRGVAGDWAVALFPWATGALAVVLPVIAAALFVFAGLFGWSSRLTLAYQALEAGERAASELRDHCMRARESASLLPFERTEARAAIATKASVVVLLTAGLLSNGACTDHATGAPGTSTETSAHTASAAVVSGEVWMDDTVSVDQRDVPVAVRAVTDALLDVSRRNNVERWSLYAFGQEPWREAPHYELELPRWIPPRCDPPTEAARIFTVHSDDTDCKARLQAARSQHRQHLENQLAALRAAVREHRRQPADCTAIGDLLVRLSQTPNSLRALIITDGQETCRRNGLPTIPPPREGVEVALVLVGSNPKDRLVPTLAEQFAARRRALLRAAPWLVVIAPWEVTGDIFYTASQRSRPRSELATVERPIALATP